MWPGAGEWGSQGRIFYFVLMFWSVNAAKSQERSTCWILSLSSYSIMINVLMMLTLVPCCTCKAAQHDDTSIRALHCSTAQGMNLICKIFTPDRPGIILATMVIFRQNWSLGYDWLWRGVGTKGGGRGDKLQEVRSSESASKQRGGRTFSILVQSYLQSPKQF